MPANGVVTGHDSCADPPGLHDDHAIERVVVRERETARRDRVLRLDHERNESPPLMPLGMALGIPPQFLIAMFPSVNGYFFIPTYGSLIAAINFDLSGTTKIGKYVLNHSFMIPGVVATAVAVITGLFLAKIMF